MSSGPRLRWDAVASRYLRSFTPIRSGMRLVKNGLPSNRGNVLGAVGASMRSRSSLDIVLKRALISSASQGTPYSRYDASAGDGWGPKRSLYLLACSLIEANA